MGTLFENGHLLILSFTLNLLIYLYILHLLIHTYIHYTLAGTFIHHTLADTYNYYTRADTNVYIFYFLDQREIFRVDRDDVFLPGRVIHGSRWSVGRSFRHVVWSLVSPVGEVRVGGCTFI